MSTPRSPIEADEKEVIKLAKKLKKEKVSPVPRLS